MADRRRILSVAVSVDVRKIEAYGFNCDLFNAKNDADNCPPPPAVSTVPAPEIDEVRQARAVRTEDEIAASLAVMKRLFYGGNYGAANQRSVAGA